MSTNKKTQQQKWSQLRLWEISELDFHEFINKCRKASLHEPSVPHYLMYLDQQNNSEYSIETNRHWWEKNETAKEKFYYNAFSQMAQPEPIAGFWNGQQIL